MVLVDTTKLEEFGNSIPVFTGCTSSAAGKKGLVPAPPAGSQAKSLKADGTWGAYGDISVGSTNLTNNSSTLADNTIYFCVQSNSVVAAYIGYDNKARKFI